MGLLWLPLLLAALPLVADADESSGEAFGVPSFGGLTAKDMANKANQRLEDQKNRGKDMIKCYKDAGSNAAAKRQCDEDAKRKFKEALGREPNDFELAEAQKEAAMKDAGDALKTCMAKAKGNLEAMKACRKDAAKKVGEGSKDASTMKGSETYRIIGESAAQNAFDEVKACAMSDKAKRKQCMEEARQKVAEEAGLDASAVTDFTLRDKARDRREKELGDTMKICKDNGGTDAECREQFKEQLKNGRMDGKPPTGAEVVLALQGAAQRAAKDVGEACKSNSKGRSACLEDIKTKLAEAMGKKKGDVSEFEARRFQEKGALKGAADSFRACFQAKRDDPSATCEDLDEVHSGMIGERGETDVKRKNARKAKLVGKVARTLVKDGRKTCFEDTNAEKADITACLQQAATEADSYIDELYKGKPADLIKKKKARAQKDADAEFFGDFFSGCMEDKSPADDNARQEAKKGCMKDLLDLKGKAEVGEDGKSIIRKHQANIFSEIASCNASIAAECRQRAKGQALASGLLTRELFQAREAGELRAASEELAGCLEAEGGSSPSDCENQAKALFLLVSGGEDSAWSTSISAKVTQLANAIVDGESTVMMFLQQISVGVRMSGNKCADAMMRELEDKVNTSGLPAAPSRTSCRVTDGKAEYSLELPANLTESDFETKSDEIVTTLGADRRLAERSLAERKLSETVESSGATQGSEECPEGATSCGQSVSGKTISMAAICRPFTSGMLTIAFLALISGTA